MRFELDAPNFYYLTTQLLLRMDRKVSLSVSFELSQVEWLDAHDENRSEVLRRLVEKERENE